MNNEEIEIQLWEYIDGTSTPEQKVQIEKHIATNGEWRDKYNELLSFNESLHTRLDVELLAKNITADVMAAINQPKTKTKTATFFTWGIRAIAAFFVITISSLLIYSISTAEFTASAPKLSEFNFSLPSYAKESIGMIISASALIFLLMMADSFFRSKLIRKSI